METAAVTSRSDEQEDKWIWGNANDTESNISNKTIIDRLQERAPSCTLLEFETANFNTSGLRISETKCFEYIKDMDSKLLSNRRKRKTERGSLPGDSNVTDVEVVEFIGGRDAIPSEFPHMGALGWKASNGDWVFKCGSSLISSNFALTAAHCTKTSARDASVADPVPKIIRLGVRNIDNDDIQREDHKISRIIVHPKYKAPKKYYDIALIELETDVEFTIHVHPICLWTSFDTGCLGKQAFGAGWGVTKADLIQVQDNPILQVGLLDIINTTKCDDLLMKFRNRHWSGIQEHQICAGKLSGGVDSCQGDSGGPLKIRIPETDPRKAMFYIIGVTSFGFRCAVEDSPGVYTRVSSFIDWIEDIVWN